ncbi:MAG: histidine--tRNA ligase, partial [Chloroflexota bacterium]|nr:histidine--tRNA ligase [Chloroflexota bacterium]
AGPAARAGRLRPMPAFRAPRGTRDLLPDDREAFARLERIATSLAHRYGYRPIETPLFEESDLFERGIGEATDVVEKELFRVQGSHGEEGRWALRPEATAGIVRAYVQHGMHTLPQPVRLSLLGPMFRYDRPQAGRYRQFWQWNVEAIGDPGPAIDAEIVELGHRFYRDAGLAPVSVHLNSIGDANCRPAYVESLRAYFRKFEPSLPELERARLASNPLRLLDSKDPAMAELIAGAPKIADRLCEACGAHFRRVREHLDVLRVPVRMAPTLVRGFDYYTRTAFEYYRAGAEGQQDALGGGGRYDRLVELLGGRPTPGIGFAIGLDRVVLALADRADGTVSLNEPVAIVVGSDAGDTATRLKIATELRAAGFTARADLATRKLRRQLEGAARDGARFAVIVGDELDGGEVQLKDLRAGTQRLVPLAEIPRQLEQATHDGNTLSAPPSLAER